jgi:hypothetical protein
MALGLRDVVDEMVVILRMVLLFGSSGLNCLVTASAAPKSRTGKVEEHKADVLTLVKGSSAFVFRSSMTDAGSSLAQAVTTTQIDGKINDINCFIEFYHFVMNIGLDSLLLPVVEQCSRCVNDQSSDGAFTR